MKEKISYKKIAEIYEKLEGKSKRLHKTFLIARLLREVGCESEEAGDVLLLLQGKVFPESSNMEIGVAARIILKAISLSSGESLSRVEDEWKRTGDLGTTAEKLVSRRKQSTLLSKKLTVGKVIANIRRLTGEKGAGSIDRKIKLIAELLTSGEGIEVRYVIRTILEELRVGVGKGIVRDALAWAFLPPIYPLFLKCPSCHEYVPNSRSCLNCGGELSQDNQEKPTGRVIRIKEPGELRGINLREYELINAETEENARRIYNYIVDKIDTAHSISNDFGVVMKQLCRGFIEGLEEIEIKPGRPIKVMLAQKVRDIKEGFERVGRPADVEYKYDGFRLQIHRNSEGEIKLFTRRLEDVTMQFPEVIGYVKNNVKAESFILDSEAVGYDSATGRYLPFQNISQRIKRKYHISNLSKQTPVEVNVFDIIYFNGKTLIKRAFKERREIIEGIIRQEPKRIVLARRIVTDKEEEAEAFYHESLKAGNEGVMMKNLKAEYKPGSRVGYMIKIKPVMETLDVVITGAEWGEGKRAHWLTSFTIAVMDREGELREIGKVGTGIKELEGQGVTFKELTGTLEPLIISSKGKSVSVKPEVVVEVKYEEIQKSPTYSSGYALRFPRVIRIRADKGVDELSSIDLVEGLYKNQRGRNTGNPNQKPD